MTTAEPAQRSEAVVRRSCRPFNTAPARNADGAARQGPYRSFSLGSVERAYEVFGGVRAVAAGEPHTPGPRVGAVLAILLAEAPQPVGLGRLIEEVWGQSPPDDPEAALHNLISRLRRLTGDDFGDHMRSGQAEMNRPWFLTALGSVEARSIRSAVETAENAPSPASFGADPTARRRHMSDIGPSTG